MAVQQQFSSDQARSVASKISKQSQVAKGAMTTVEKDIKAMESWWKGESSTAFAAQFQELKPSLTKMVQLVEDISAQLNQVAKAKDEAEQNIANAIRR